MGNEDQPRVPAGSPEGGEWTGNKGVVASSLEKIGEARMPGKGAALRDVYMKHWDSQADDFTNPGRLASMGYKMDDQMVNNTLKGIVQRHPEIVQEVAALKK